MTQDNILVLNHVTKNFGGIVASNDVSIAIPKGSIYGIIGPNGAGKTTLFNIITGVYNSTSGEVLFNGKKINGLSTHEISKLGIARTFQNIRLFGSLSIYDNLLTACTNHISYGLITGLIHSKKYKVQEKEASETCCELLKEIGLYEIRDNPANSLPYGMQRRLEIARALATDPKLILLDEPAAGMNGEESEKLSLLIKRIQDNRKISIIIIDHHMDVIMDVCQYISVLDFGSLLAEGKPEDIQKNPAVIEAYLGADDNVKN